MKLIIGKTYYFDMTLSAHGVLEVINEEEHIYGFKPVGSSFPYKRATDGRVYLPMLAKAKNENYYSEIESKLN